MAPALQNLSIKVDEYLHSTNILILARYGKIHNGDYIAMQTQEMCLLSFTQHPI